MCRVASLAGVSLRRGSREFRWLVSLKRELAANNLVLLGTGKFGFFDVLPVQGFIEKVAVAFDSFLSSLSVHLKKIENVVCSICKESETFTMGPKILAV